MPEHPSPSQSDPRHLETVNQMIEHFGRPYTDAEAAVARAGRERWAEAMAQPREPWVAVVKDNTPPDGRVSMFGTPFADPDAAQADCARHWRDYYGASTNDPVVVRLRVGQTLDVPPSV